MTTDSLIRKLNTARNDQCNCKGEMGRCLVHEFYDDCISIAQVHNAALVERLREKKKRGVEMMYIDDFIREMTESGE